MNKEKIKVVFLAGEIGIHTSRFLKHFGQSKRHDVHLVSFTTNSIPIMPGVSIHNIKLGNPFFMFFMQVLICYYFIRKINPDIIHGCNLTSYGFYASLMPKVPILQMAYGSDIMLAPKNKFYRIIVKKSLRSSTMATVDCKLGKKKMIQLGTPSSKVKVFPWGVDLNNFSPSKKNRRIFKDLGWNNKKVLICPRAHYPIYGIDYLIRSMKIVIKKESNARLLLFRYDNKSGILPLTADSYSSEYGRLIKKLGLSDYIKIIDSVNQDKLSEYLASSDLYITTSISDGTSVNLLEAMSSGLPVVATDVGANSEWISSGINGYLCDSKDVKSISNATITLLEDSKNMLRMGRLNRKLAVKKANWNENLKSLEAIYEKILRMKL